MKTALATGKKANPTLQILRKGAVNETAAIGMDLWRGNIWNAIYSSGCHTSNTHTHTAELEKMQKRATMMIKRKVQVSGATGWRTDY